MADSTAKRPYFARNQKVVLILVLGFMAIGLAWLALYGGRFKSQPKSGTDLSQERWDFPSAQLYLDAKAYQDAENVGNRSDMAITLGKIQRECHEDELLQTKTPGPRELASRKLCASAGFPMPPP